MQRVEERSTAISTKLLFFELEWAELPDERVETLLADERLAFARHHLRSARRYRPHLLTEPEEVVLTEKSITGRSAWERLFEEQVSSIAVELDGETDDARSRARAVARARPRRAPAPRPRPSPRGSQPGSAHARVRLQHAARRQGDRRPAAPLRQLDREPQPRRTRRATSRCRRSSTRCSGRYSIPQRWYALKAQLLGLDRLADYDRMASVADVEAQIGWRDGARSSCSTRTGRSRGELADTAQRFFDGAWIDAPARPGKRPGAFCAYTVPSHHPYVLLNWTSTPARRAHARARARPRPARVPRPRTGRVPPDDAADAGRDRVGVRRDRHVRSPARRGRPIRSERLALLASNLEDQIATVFRQIAMNRFENAMHTARRERGRAVGRALRRAVGRRRRRAMLGDSVEITEGYRTWWSYIPHFIAHAGLRVRVRVRPAARAVGVRAVRGAGRRRSCRSTSTCLRAGGSMAPEELGKLVDVDLADPGVLGPRPRHHRTPPRRDDRGRRGRREGCHDVPRHPVEHRQRRRGRVAVHHPPSRTRARRRVGALATTRPGKDAGELCGLAPTGVLATNDVDALLALDADCVSYTATADLRPMDAITDMARILASGKNVVSSSVVAAVWPAHLDPRCARRSTTRARRRACRASRRASTRVGRTTCCRCCSPARARTSSSSASWRSSTTRTTSSRPCCSRRWASARRSTPSRCC